MGKAEKIMKGIAIILKYDADADTCAEHDEFFCGHGVYDAMTPEDAAAMENLDWDYEDGSWKINT